MRRRSARERARGIVAEHRHLAAVARAVALEDLDGGGLAGAVGPEQPEHLAAAHLDVDPAHGLVLAVALAQVAHLDRGARRSRPNHRRGVSSGTLRGRSPAGRVDGERDDALTVDVASAHRPTPRRSAAGSASERSAQRHRSMLVSDSASIACTASARLRTVSVTGTRGSARSVDARAVYTAGLVALKGS